MHERPAFAQQHVRDIAALQGEGTEQQDLEVPMDQLGSHEVGSSGRSTCSGTMQGTRAEARAALELEALQNYPYAVDSATPSERDDRQVKEADYIGSPETVQGDDGEEDEYTGEEPSDDENEEEGKTSQAMKRKDAEPGGGGPKGKGVGG